MNKAILAAVVVATVVTLAAPVLPVTIILAAGILALAYAASPIKLVAVDLEGLATADAVRELIADARRQDGPGLAYTGEDDQPHADLDFGPITKPAPVAQVVVSKPKRSAKK